jgi:alkanesulfonate monooxygenase SsuD/methylene tetrahydromethanopterin reductase-like flavin-dependent oxidoreductase (luciferase family)
MRLGLMVGYWGLGMGPADQLAVVQEAERLGFHSAWAAEAYGSDAATVLAWLAAGTSTIGLGAGIFQMPGRSPAMTAMTAATIDELSGGRMLLGIGSSGPQVSEGWHGQRFAQQLQRTREYVAVVRIALSRERVVFEGETLQLPLPDGPGRPLKLTIEPVQDRIPIYLAAIGPRNTTLAGSPTAGCRRSSRPRTSASSVNCCGRAPTAPGARSTASTSPPPCRSTSPMTTPPHGI